MAHSNSYLISGEFHTQDVDTIHINKSTSRSAGDVISSFSIFLLITTFSLNFLISFAFRKRMTIRSKRRIPTNANDSFPMLSGSYSFIRVKAKQIITKIVSNTFHNSAINCKKQAKIFRMISVTNSTKMINSTTSSSVSIGYKSSWKDMLMKTIIE